MTTRTKVGLVVGAVAIAAGLYYANRPAQAPESTAQTATAPLMSGQTVGQPSAAPTTELKTVVPSQCAGIDELWTHVYHGMFPTPQGRLHVLEPCKTVTGTIFFDGFEKDGDRHLRLRPDPEFADLLVDANITVQHGGLVVEPMCAKAPTQHDTIIEGVCVQFSQTLYDPATMKNTHVSVSAPAWCKVT